MRLIDVDAEIKWANENLPDAHKNVIIAFLMDCYAIDPESLRQHGKWKTKKGNYFTGGGNPIWECSECDFAAGASMCPPKFRYCPNCAARMDKELRP